MVLDCCTVYILFLMHLMIVGWQQTSPEVPLIFYWCLQRVPLYPCWSSMGRYHLRSKAPPMWLHVWHLLHTKGTVKRKEFRLE